jgi:hypothetical protein
VMVIIFRSVVIGGCYDDGSGLILRLNSFDCA